jgi:AraC-like DNA-binding protein
MLFEPTTLAATASALIEALEPYGCDSEDLFRKAGLNTSAITIPGARYPLSAVNRLWQLARDATGDPCIGLFVGRSLRPAALHALGFAWLASPDLLQGLERMARYARIANSTLRPEIVVTENRVKVVRVVESSISDEAVDGFLSAVIHMCRAMSNAEFAPELVTIKHPDNGHIDQYVSYFKSPVEFDADEDALHFDLTVLQQPLPVSNLELAHANDKVAERYLATLDPDLVQDKVREILLDLMPSGSVSQNEVAEQLHRSVSSLQRQLQSEGVSYRQILEDTRRALATQFVREERYSLSQIAYLLGFSDQANFSRAFKRWTGQTPTGFRTGGQT